MYFDHIHPLLLPYPPPSSQLCAPPPGRSALILMGTWLPEYGQPTTGQALKGNWLSLA